MGHYDQLISSTWTFFFKFDDKKNFSWEFFQKNIFLISGIQDGIWKIMSKIKENWFDCGVGQSIWVWETQWYSEIAIFWKMSTQGITITTSVYPQSSIYLRISIDLGTKFSTVITQNPHIVRPKSFGIVLVISFLGGKNIGEKIEISIVCTWLTLAEIGS